jgi:uncharacterized surface protein with fasciclin (FAS1) repeats
MKQAFFSSTILSIVFTASLFSQANANNATVENALKARPELSNFYQGLVNTGVLSELKENASYTVFAPTNDAFDKISPEKYACFYSQACKADVAEVLRHHIVKGEHPVRTGSDQQGSINSLFSINDYHVIASEPFKDNFTINGVEIKKENQLAGGILYSINGVLATPRELAVFSAPTVTVVHKAGSDLPPRVPAGTIVTITHEIPAE